MSSKILPGPGTAPFLLPAFQSSPGSQNAFRRRSMQADYDVRGTLHATGNYFFLPNGGKPEEIDGTQIFEEGVDRRQARDEEAQGWYAEERPLGPEGQEPQTGDCDRAVGGEGQGQEGAEEGGQEAQGFEEKDGEEAEGEEVEAVVLATAVIASEAKQSIAPHAETWIASSLFSSQ
jgi:hypothetical protein